MLSRSPAPPAGFIEPCLPTPSRTVPDGAPRAFEVKHDGFRFIAWRDGDRVRAVHVRFAPKATGVRHCGARQTSKINEHESCINVSGL
jgi:hypothetical protein